MRLYMGLKIIINRNENTNVKRKCKNFNHMYILIEIRISKEYLPIQEWKLNSV